MAMQWDVNYEYFGEYIDQGISEPALIFQKELTQWPEMFPTASSQSWQSESIEISRNRSSRLLHSPSLVAIGLSVGFV